ncbi:hypothetical protein [Paenibacillus sp. NPDC058071]|uniref:hypothetical protein n=1 Tax=Paenibacillus sp. NPDC058071 TaxID=3346326 RepID=UPI0036D9CBD9
MKWKFLLPIVLAVILLTGSWMYHNRSDAVYDRIINKNGYALSLVKEQVAVEFTLKPEWLPKKDGEENRLKLVIAEKFGTQIILDSIIKNANELHIELNAVSHPDRESGQLLTAFYINPNGSFTTNSDFNRWSITDSAGRDLLGGQFGMGDGPGNLTGISIESSQLHKFEQDVLVRFSGYNLYSYHLLDSGLSSYLYFIPLLIVLALLPLLYRRRTSDERGLEWRLIGYTLLGGFTLSLNEVKLPLGFAVYFPFFSKTKANFAIKNKAALLGLLLYLWQLFMPAAAGLATGDFKSAVIRHVSEEELGYDGLWKSLIAQTKIGQHAKLADFEVTHAESGEWIQLNFRLVERSGDRYLHTEALYDVQKLQLKLTRHASTNQWVQYDRQMDAGYFFEQADLLQFAHLRDDDFPYGKLKLMSDGTKVSYGIKEGHKFEVNENGVKPIENDQLPVQGYWLHTCGVNSEKDNGCASRADYLFDVKA